MNRRREYPAKAKLTARTADTAATNMYQRRPSFAARTAIRLQNATTRPETVVAVLGRNELLASPPNVPASAAAPHSRTGRRRLQAAVRPPRDGPRLQMPVTE